MSKTDHLAKAKEYVAKGDDYYLKAGDHMVALEDDGWTYAAIAREVGKSRHWVARVVSATKRSRATGEPFEAEWESGSNKRDEVARKVLSDPEQRRAVVASLAPQEKEALAREISASVPTPEARMTPEVASARLSMGDKDDLQVEAMSLIALAGRVGLLLSEGHEFKRLSDSRREDLNAGLEDAAHVVEQLRAQIREQTPVAR